MRLSSYTKEAEAPTGLTGNPARDLARSFNIRVILFLSLHIPLAMAMELSPWVSTIHALLVLLLGLWAALLGRFSQVVYAVVYISAAEVLWRMSRANLLWEYSKYAIVVVIFVAVISEWSRRGETRRLRSVWPIFLTMLLVPASVMAVMYYSPTEARDALSFNLSGYAALLALGLYLWNRPMNREVTVRMLLVIMAPIVGITFLAVYYTFTDLDSLIFLGGAANWVTSGNYGPNQVSNIMGLGALAGVMLFVLMPRAWGARVVILGLTLAMLGQGLLTFSRGGVYSFVLALAAFGFHLATTPRARRSFLILFVLFGLILLAFVYPALDQFTGGSLSERFSNLDTTGRLEAAITDLEVFRDNPLVGVGVGRSIEYHVTIDDISLSAHTEYTRLLAEHGLLGILAIVVIIGMIVNRYLANHDGLGRAMTAGLAVWSMSIMVHSAIRLAVIPLAIALGFVLWQLKVTDEKEVDSPVSLPVGEVRQPLIR